jgi:hypothetical protein
MSPWSAGLQSKQLSNQQHVEGRRTYTTKYYYICHKELFVSPFVWQPVTHTACFILVSCAVYSSTMKMEATCSPQMLISSQWTSWNLIPVDTTGYNECCDNLKSFTCHFLTNLFGGGLQWHTWFRHYAVSLKVEGSISDQLIELFHLHFGPGIISASNIHQYQKSSWGKGDWHITLTTSWPPVSQFSRKCGSFDCSQPYGPLQPVIEIALLFIFFFKFSLNWKFIVIFKFFKGQDISPSCN